MEVSSSDEEVVPEQPKQPTGGAFDSSDEEPGTDDEMPRLEEHSEHEDDGDEPSAVTMDGWRRDDKFSFNQRSQAGWENDHGAQLRNLPEFASCGRSLAIFLQIC